MLSELADRWDECCVCGRVVTAACCPTASATQVMIAADRAGDSLGTTNVAIGCCKAISSKKKTD